MINKTQIKNLLLWGGTGQGIVLEEILKDKYSIIGLVDNNSDLKNPFDDIPFIGDECCMDSKCFRGSK